MNTKTERERIRKAYAPRGERTQKRMTFLLDQEHETWMKQQQNKGRYLNGLIAEDREQKAIAEFKKARTIGRRRRASDDAE